ncbi:MAG TPA: FAD-dependent oxidoreductase [Pseudonocardiaceae bacterium]|nr:FAD-dependent oxidoreductase [Pseudonocardiaceae bacterium]
MTARRVVVIGHGMAGARLAGELRRHDPVAERVAVTVLGDEPHAAYNRVLLSGVLSGSLELDAVRMHESDWPTSQRVDLRLGVAVTSLDRARRRVRLADESAVAYDALVLATGARPWLPEVEGLLADRGGLAAGVFAFRTRDDCARIVAEARPGMPVAVLGGGLLGLEAARGLAGRGCLVTVIHPNGHVLDRQIDPAAGHMLRRILERIGIEFRVGTTAARYLPGDGLKLADGGHVAAEMVVVSAGVRAETDLARAAGLAVDRGVLVDDALRTNDPRVHAIGDCAQHASTESGLVQPAFDQAAVLAARLTGVDPAARYRGTPIVTRLKARGVELASMGDVHLDVGGEHPSNVEVIAVQDPARGRYGKLVLRDERVAGAILLGLPDAAATIIQLFDSRAPVPADRLGLLLGRALPAEQLTATSAAGLADEALVCRCNSVTKAGIVAAWRTGARDVPALATATRATTGCGGCRAVVGGITDWLATSA